MEKLSPKYWRIKDGRYIHDGDCHFWSEQICTCGLIHHLLPNHSEEDWYGEEWGMHKRQLDRIPKPLLYTPLSDEEAQKRASQILKDVFGQGKD